MNENENEKMLLKALGATKTYYIIKYNQINGQRRFSFALCLKNLLLFTIFPHLLMHENVAIFFICPDAIDRINSV